MDNLIKAIEECIPDLKHYAATHGPGPDRRLAELMEALEKIKRDTACVPKL